MSLPKRVPAKIILVYVVLVLICSYATFVRLYSGRGFDPISSALSIIFAWQSLYIILFSIVSSVAGLYIHNLKLCMVSILSIIVPLILFLTAYEIQASGRFMTGIAPSGPDFNCLTWKEPVHINLYDRSFSYENVMCVLYHVPDYNKFWFDQSEAASSNNFVSYYLTFFVFQGLLYLPLLVWQRRNIAGVIHRNT